MRDRPESTSEDVHYGKTLDPKQQKDPKKLGRVRVRVPELDGEAGSGIPDEHLPLTQLERHENYGTQEEMSHFQMPQKDAHVKMRFHGDDPYSSLGSGAPYSKPGAISEFDDENQYQRYGQKDPLANINNYNNMGKKDIHSDHTQMDGPHNHRTRGVTTFYFTNSKSNTPGANKFDQGNTQQTIASSHHFLFAPDGKVLKSFSKSGDGRLHDVVRNHLGMEGPARDIGGFQDIPLDAGENQGKAKVNYFADEEITLAIVKPKQQQQQQMQAMGLLHMLLGADAGAEKPHEADDKDLKKLAFVKLEKKKITIQVNDENGEEQKKTMIQLTDTDITIESVEGKVVIKAKSDITADSQSKIGLTAPTIFTAGNTKLGSEDASKPVSAQGTIDSRGDSDISNFLTKVTGT